MRDPSFDTSDYRGSRATREPRETFEFHLLALDPRPRFLYPDDTELVAWEQRQTMTGDARKIADLKALGPDRVARIEMVTPEIYQNGESK